MENGECFGVVFGDTNGDCSFDVLDIQFLQLYMGDPSQHTNLTAHQLQAIDPDLDGDSDGVDIDYLMKVLANKYRFLDPGTFEWVALPFSLSATIRTSSSELASSAQTSVLFEIGTSLNLSLIHI